MKGVLSLALFAAFTLGSAEAWGDDAACLSAASKGQRARATHKLIEAREQLRLCAAAACPPVVQSDCAGWLALVEKALPSVVTTAKDEAGASLIDVKVTVDGQPFATRLEGQAVALNPGSHTFHFEGPGGATVDQIVLAAEGEQNQRVAVVLPRRAPQASVAPASRPAPNAQAATVPPSSAAVAGPSAAASTGAADTGRTPPPDTARGGSPWKTVGWVVGAVGVVGLGVGTAFGIMAMNDQNAAHCNANKVCLSGPLDAAKSAAFDANVSLAAGGVLAATGLALVLFAPSGEHPRRPAVTASVAPLLVPAGGGLGVGGTW
jgi:hypothetical protein